jgi:competence protein ComGC
MKKFKGITLIELIVIICIIVVLAMIIVPAIIDYNNQHSGNIRAVVKLDNGESITVEVDYWEEMNDNSGLVKIKGKDGSTYYVSPNNVVIYNESE